MVRIAVAAGSALLCCPALAGEQPARGMPQLDPSSYASQLFWLGVFFVLFYAFMSLVGMPRMRRILEKRQARIADDLDRASGSSARAEALRRDVDIRLATARDNARALLVTASDKAAVEAAERQRESARQLATRIEVAEAAIAASRDDALKSLNGIAASLVEIIVRKCLVKPLMPPLPARQLPP